MQSYHGPPAASMEEVQEYARGMSEGWMQTFEMYQQKVEEMEQAIQEDQAMLSDLQREKMLHTSELDKLRTDAEKQGQLQMRLEEQLLHMQEKFSRDEGEYQMIIEQLERERNTMAEAIAQRMQDHQHLLRVKMDLGMEVAAYRALLEGERVGLQDAHRRMNQRERIIDIKTHGQLYTPRTSTTTRQRMDVRFTPSTSIIRRSPVAPSGSGSPSRVIPISLASRAQHQSPASRRDLVSFTKARAATSSAVPKDKEIIQNERQSATSAEKTRKVQHVSKVENKTGSTKSSAETISGRVISPPRRSLDTKPEMERSMKGADKPVKGNLYESESKNEDKTKSTIESSERKGLDGLSVEEIIETVIKPAGLEAKVCPSGESKITYHVEKTEQGDGSMKTQIVLQSKVAEEVDVSEESALDQLLSQGVKKVSLEDIEDTATGSMIRNLLSGLQAEGSLQNKSVNVEIIEQPVESYEEEVTEESRSCYGPSAYFQIEEMEEDQDTHFEKSGDDTTKRSKVGTVQAQEESEALYFTHDQEPAEYFVSTPDDNLSEPEEGCGITSYGHYGMVDDLSDERYYQDDRLPPTRTILEENDQYRFMSDRTFLKESIPECIIEEEIRVSPVVQESMLEFLREDSLEPKEQLRGALEKLQGSVSGPLREELAFLTKVSSESPQNVAVDIKKVQQSSGSGTTTIVAELNVSQTLEDSGLLDEDDLSEEQIMAALRSSHFGGALQGGSGEGYTFRISKEQRVVVDDDFDIAREGESSSLVTERQIKVGPSEKRSISIKTEGHSSHTDVSSDQE
ncbi:synemin isoform X2 [Festucalex cinctus]